MKNKKIKLAYILGPYRGKNNAEIKENIMTAKWYQLKLTQKYKGIFFISPHANTEFLDGAQSDKYFLEGTLELLRRCDMYYKLPGWEKSSGSRGEVKEAQKLGLTELEDEL